MPKLSDLMYIDLEQYLDLKNPETRKILKRVKIDSYDLLLKYFINFSIKDVIQKHKDVLAYEQNELKAYDEDTKNYKQQYDQLEKDLIAYNHEQDRRDKDGNIQPQ